MKNGKQLLFVYGTLKPMARKRRGRVAHVTGRMWCNGLYPAVRLEPRGQKLAGIVFEVTDDDLLELDAREGIAADWYRRVIVRTLEGQVAWVYEAERCLYQAGGMRAQWQPVAANGRGVVVWDSRRPYWRTAGEVEGEAEFLARIACAGQGRLPAGELLFCPKRHVAPR